MPSFSWGPFCGYVGEGHLWFRLFGYGVHVKDTHKAPLLFSERHGYQGFALGRLYVRPLWGYDIPPKVSTQEFGFQKEGSPYMPPPPLMRDFGALERRVLGTTPPKDVEQLSLDTEGSVDVKKALEKLYKSSPRPDGKDGHYIFNAYTYKGRMRPPYAVIARRTLTWVVLRSGIQKFQEAQNFRAEHCKQIPETWTWVGPNHIAAWAMANHKNPDTYKPRRPKKANKRGRK